MTKYPSLTIIRFFAALMVYCSHYGVPLFVSVGSWAVNLFCRGGEAVILFFLLSGFLMTVVYENRTVKPFTFYVSRFARIYPLYALALLLHAPFFYFFLRGTNPALLSDPTFLSKVVFLKFLMLDPYNVPLMKTTGWLLPGWSIGCEMLFYAAFPFAARFVYKIRERYLVAIFLIILVCAWLVHAAPLWSIQDKHSEIWKQVDIALQFLPPARILDFAVGVFAGLVVLKLDSVRQRLAEMNILLLVLTVGFQSVSPVGLTSESWHLLVFRLLYILLIASLYARDRHKPYPQTRLIRLGILAGEISFAMYLFQGVVRDYIRLGLRIAHIELSPNGSMLLALPALIVISYMVHKLFEIPLRAKILAKLGKS